MGLCVGVEPGAELLHTVNMDEGPKPQTCPLTVAGVDWALLATQNSGLSAGGQVVHRHRFSQGIHRFSLHLCLCLLSCPICLSWRELAPSPCEADVPCSPSLAWALWMYY